MIRVAIVGAGRRVRDLYLPVLDRLGEQFQVVGFTSRSGRSARELADVRGATAHESLGAMVQQSDPGLVIVAVNAGANAAVASAAIAAGRPVLMETPIGLTTAEAQGVVRAAARSGRPVGIAEQKPFLPWNCFAQAVLSAGAIGRAIVVENDYRAIEYHACAQLRRLLDPAARPTAVQAVTASFDVAARSGADVNRRERWLAGSIQFDDGTLALTRSTDLYGRTASRSFSRSLRVYGTHGSLVNDEIAVVDSRGETHRVVVERSGMSGAAPSRISCTLPGERVLAWDNPLGASPASEDQVGLSMHLLQMAAAITRGADVLYGPHNALLDVELADALTLSSRMGGAPVVVSHRCADSACRPRPRGAASRQHLDLLIRRVGGAPWPRALMRRMRSSAAGSGPRES